MVLCVMFSILSLCTGPKLSDKPTLPQLRVLKVGEKEMKILNHVAHDWSSIAIMMNFDDGGQMRDRIEKDKRGVTLSCCEAMFEAWVGKKGRRGEPTWELLITILKECDLNVIAEDIENMLS